MGEDGERTLIERLRGTDPALLRLVVFFGGLTVAVVLFIAFDEIFLPLLMGLAVAYLFDPPVSWLERKGVKRVLGVILLALVLLLTVAGFFLYLVPAMGEQVERLADRLPAYRERLEAQVDPLLERVQQWLPSDGEADEAEAAGTKAQPVAGDGGQAAAAAPQEPGAAVEAAEEGAEPPAVASTEELAQRLRQAVQDNLPTLAGLAGKILQGLGKGLRSFFDNIVHVLLLLLNLIFVPVFAFYLLVDFPKIKQGIKDLVPIPYREMVIARVKEVDLAVAGFLRGQLVIALVLAAINATGLMILRVPLGLVIGLVAGLANMIPYMALVVGLIPALLLCWVEHQSWLRLLGVVLVFSGAQLLEGTVLSPRILSKTVNLHPVWVLLAVIAGGSLFGFIGMLIAVPVAAAIHVFARHWLRLYRSSRIYRGEGAAGS